MDRAESAIGQTLNIRREKLEGLRGRLTGVGPISTLKRGYAIVRRRGDEAIVCSIEHVETGDRLDIRVADGDFEAEAR
jgi:exodeoxyribonuclease VII large subunit